MVGMAGSWNPEDRVVERGGREAPSFGKIDANAMADYRTYCWSNGNAVLRKISEITGRSRGKGERRARFGRA